MTATIDGRTVRYEVGRGVSLNRQNPHRVTAFCHCGVQFMSLAASDATVRTVERVERAVAEQHARHVQSGRCKEAPPC